MEAKATAKFIRISPRKVREVVDLIRGKNIQEALAILRYTPRRASEAVTKVVKSAAANAEHNKQAIRDELFVTAAYVDQGPTLKRFQPRAMGRADILRKRSSHITIVVGDKKEDRF
ncbi:MAG: 50S ribosomal protein L22 [Pelotomaculum sp. PtaU1.Bin035]|nr:MAG: 50S ribosomal protein L22 [Pelotomaculum sp. PtaU1.Bin035]